MMAGATFCADPGVAVKANAENATANALAAKTRHFTSYKQATDHELLTAISSNLEQHSKAA
jgi:hypothetical protein